MEDKKILCLNEDKVKSLANEAILEMKIYNLFSFYILLNFV